MNKPGNRMGDGCGLSRATADHNAIPVNYFVGLKEKIVMCRGCEQNEMFK